MSTPRILSSILEAREMLVQAGVSLAQPPVLELHPSDYADILASIPLVVPCPAEDVLVCGCRITPASHCQPGDVFYRQAPPTAPTEM